MYGRMHGAKKKEKRKEMIEQIKIVKKVQDLILNYKK